MPRPKGTPKYGGRQKGTPNKRPAALRQLIQDFCDEHFNDYIESMAALKLTKPEAYVREFGNALRFCTPMLQSIDANVDTTVTEEQKTVEQRLTELNESVRDK